MRDDRDVPLVARERERKFALDPGLPVPLLTGTGPVTAQREPVTSRLDATYFDTADRRLARAGITLRRRSGGPDAGWHLKLPAGPDARDEIRLPPDAVGDPVPPALAGRVRAETGGADLAAIARLRTDRTSYVLADEEGHPVAVLTDDDVRGETSGVDARRRNWRELELELEPAANTGLLDLLGEALIRAGARPVRWPSKLSRLLAEEVPDTPAAGRS
ncbi:MAG TPA: CYTH domain-containing protein [Amycolatopsis sp.]|nr:CYTH domain-containing protein [Amycolatopsis sp.]